MAKCPVCKNTALQAAQLDNNLPAMECTSCGGSWLRASEYALWLRSQAPGSFDESKIKEASIRFPIAESNQAAICPDCGHFLRKYRLGSTIDFHLDRCNHCNGVWFDQNEWQSLKMADLHDEINQIFTEPWQRHVQNQMTAGKLDTLYLNKFGESDYKKIQEIRKWLQDNPNRNILLAFLSDDDPFSG